MKAGVMRVDLIDNRAHRHRLPHCREWLFDAAFERGDVRVTGAVIGGQSKASPTTLPRSGESAMNGRTDTSSESIRAGGPPSRGEWLAIVVAIAIAHAFYWHLVLYPSAADARSYLDIASDIERHGVFSKFPLSDIR